MKAKHLSLAFDFDDTVTRFYEIKLQMILSEFGITLPPEHLKKTVIERSGLMTRGQYDHIQKIVWGSASYSAQALPEPGAIETLTEFVRQGHRVTIVTSRTDEMLDWATNWLKAHGLTIPIIGVGYGQSKSQALRKIKAQLFVDDDWPKLTDLVGIVPNLALYSRPFNVGEQLPPGILRVSSWEEIRALVKTL